MLLSTCWQRKRGLTDQSVSIVFGNTRSAGNTHRNKQQTREALTSVSLTLVAHCRKLPSDFVTTQALQLSLSRELHPWNAPRVQLRFEQQNTQDRPLNVQKLLSARNFSRHMLRSRGSAQSENGNRAGPHATYCHRSSWADTPYSTIWLQLSKKRLFRGIADPDIRGTDIFTYSKLVPFKMPNSDFLFTPHESGALSSNFVAESLLGLRTGSKLLTLQSCYQRRFAVFHIWIDPCEEWTLPTGLNSYRSYLTSIWSYSTFLAGSNH